jgi:hypothetical protein
MKYFFILSFFHVHCIFLISTYSLVIWCSLHLFCWACPLKQNEFDKQEKFQPTVGYTLKSFWTKVYAVSMCSLKIYMVIFSCFLCFIYKTIFPKAVAFQGSSGKRERRATTSLVKVSPFSVKRGSQWECPACQWL